MRTKKLYIHTFGCQMNVQDSEKMGTVLKDSGYEMTEKAENADLILVNTCSIREKAAQKVYSQLGRFRALKADNPRLVIGVGGCLAQHLGNDLFHRAPYVDLVFGTHNIHRLPEMISALEGGREKIAETVFLDHVHSLEMSATPLAGAISTFVTIMQGCNNFCAYCVVPHLRGREESRPLTDIVREVEHLAAGGIREVTLLGQNVNSYGMASGKGSDFADLIHAIDGIAGIERIRFTTSHPKDLSQRLIGCFGEAASLCEHIHLPLQSGSDRVLKRMNRGYTTEAYMQKIADLRHACPRISITSDVIVGFPGEGEEDFRATLAFMEEIRFDNLFSFQYSTREGTAAAGMDGRVCAKEKRERLQILQALQAEHTVQKNREMVGRLESVLVEGPSKIGDRDMTGRTRGNRIVNFPGNAGLTGKTVDVRITEAFMHSLRGQLEERGREYVH